jgi:hypothetical protein
VGGVQASSPGEEEACNAPPAQKASQKKKHTKKIKKKKINRSRCKTLRN